MRVMEHQAALIETIAVGLGAAFVGGLVARRLRLSPIVGYLLAGVVVGPFTTGLEVDTATAGQLAELGIILLMFGVGIHFSIPDLLAVRGIAVPGAVIHSALATVLGIPLGLAAGWGFAGGLVLGMSVSVASTVVLLRALEERNELDTPQGRISVGILVVEDILTILVLVLLPSLAPLLAGTTGTSAAEIALAVSLGLVKAGVFAALMLVAGTRVVPWILVSVARERSRELFTLAVLAIAIGVGFLASAVFGVSFALGAFLAGAVLSGSDTSHQAAADALPLRDAFSVLFFVSVGMLLDPAAIAAEPLALATLIVLVVVGKAVLAFVIVGASGYPLRVSLTVSAALAQIGEFSFILASLGLTLGLLPEAAYQLIVAAAVASIALNPLVFGLVDPVDRWLRARPALRGALERGSADLSSLVRGREELHGHAILCGYGRVGRLVAGALERRGFEYVVIADDRREIERLRAREMAALYGDPASDALLDEAGLAHARVVIVATADLHVARLVVDRVRARAPRLPLVVRTHSGSEASRLRTLGATVQPVYAEREVAIQLTRFSLRRFGLSTVEVDAIASGLRHHDPGDPGEAVPESPPGMLARAVGRLRSAFARDRASAAGEAPAVEGVAGLAAAAPGDPPGAPPAGPD